MNAAAQAARRLPILYKLALAAAFILLVRYGWFWLVHAWALIRFPYDVDYGEGPLLNQAHLLLSGAWPYQDIDVPPYIVGNYPPVYTALVALGLKLTGAQGFWVGRLISSAAIAGSALLIGLLVKRLSGRAWAGWLAGLLLFSMKYVYIWGSWHRIDSLALFWSLLGLWWVVRHRDDERAWWAALFFLLAVYTRQSMIAAAAAGLIWLFTQNRRQALKAAAACLVGGAAVFGFLEWRTHGEFYKHIVTYNQNAFSWRSTFNWLRGWWALAPLFILVAGWGALLAVWNWRRAGVLGLYWLFAWGETLTIGKVGSSYNYFFDLLAASCLAAGFAAASAAAPDRRRFGGLLCGLALLVQLGLWWHGAPHQRGDWSYTPRLQDGRDDARIVALIRASDRPAIAEDMGLIVLAGKPIVFQPFELTQVARDGHWDISRIVKLLDLGAYGPIVLDFDVNNGGWHTSRFAPAILQAIKENYHLQTRIGGRWIYAPD